jgi:hypothetical protein
VIFITIMIIWIKNMSCHVFYPLSAVNRIVF